MPLDFMLIKAAGSSDRIKIKRKCFKIKNYPATWLNLFNIHKS